MLTRLRLRSGSMTDAMGPPEPAEPPQATDVGYASRRSVYGVMIAAVVAIFVIALIVPYTVGEAPKVGSGTSVSEELTATPTAPTLEAAPSGAAPAATAGGPA